jgi:hypothetical protein
LSQKDCLKVESFFRFTTFGGGALLVVLILLGVTIDYIALLGVVWITVVFCLLYWIKEC